MKKSQKGFSPVAVLVIVVVLGFVGFIGWSVWRQRTKTKIEAPKAQSTQKEEDKPDSSMKTFKLAGDLVTLEAPLSWTKEGEGCSKSAPAYSEQDALDSIAIIPGEKLPTSYGNGTEFFVIRVCAFSNKKNLSAQDWYSDASKGGIGEGVPSGEDQSSKDSINSYDTYYHKRINSEYEELNYVFSAHGKIVYIKARTYEPSTSSGGKTVGDFRKFETSIIQMTKSLSVK